MDQTKYVETQRIGKIAIYSGYNGILAPSARADGGDSPPPP